MSKLTVGVVDYGIGNQASVWQCLQRLGYRCRVSDDREVLALCDLVVLPGVGAFPRAMLALEGKGLDTFLRELADNRKPIFGICLGMQLLTEASYEGQYTRGLGLIPGQTVPLPNARCHIGWNTVDPIYHDSAFGSAAERVFYFNHSYVYSGSADFQVGRTHLNAPFASVIQRGRVAGVQFHPEKSQEAGRSFLRSFIGRLLDA